MRKVDQRFVEDRALRDAAKAVFVADVAHVRSSLSGKGLAERVGGRIGDGAKDVFEVAKSNANDQRGIIAALIGAILLWLSRDSILELLGLQNASADEDTGDLPNQSSAESGSTDLNLGEPSNDGEQASQPATSPGDNDE